MQIINAIKKKVNDFFAPQQYEVQPDYENMSTNELIIRNFEFRLRMSNETHFPI